MKEITRTLAAVLAMSVAVSPMASAQSWRDILKDAVPGSQPNSGGNGKSRAEAALEAAAIVGRLKSAEVSPSPSPSQTQVHSYAGNYRIQGGLAGAAAGAIIGCIIANNVGDGNCEDGILVGVLAGTTVGVVAGGAIAKRQETYAAKEASLQSKIEVAQQDLDDARATRKAAEQLSADHAASIRSLKSQLSSRKISQSEYNKQIGYMTKDVEAVQAAQKGLQGQLAALNQAIANAPPSGDRNKLSAVYAELQKESAAMDRALQGLSSTVDQGIA